MLVGDIVRQNAKNWPRQPAIVCGTDRFDYATLNIRVNRVANALVRRRVKYGDRVAVLGRNSIDYLCLYFATAKVGAVLVPLNFWHRAEEHRYVFTDSEPKVLFYEPEYEPVVREATAGLAIDLLRLTPALEETSPDADWQDFISGAGDEEPDTKIQSDSAHMILYTSGTTGRPKGAVLSHGRTIADAFGMVAAMRLRQNDTFINYFPSFHVGNWDHMKLFLLVGARVVLMREFDAAAALAAIERERVTVVLGVPTMLHALLTHSDFGATDLSSIRLVYYGAYDPSGIIGRTADVFGAREGRIEMGHTYGLTEGGPFISYCPPEQVFSHWGSIGRAIPGIEVALLDDSGHRVRTGQPGEICARGPRMTGYWRNTAATEAALAGGWLHTGDVGVADEDGFLWIVDRKKDMIRTGGQNVFSKEVEDCLAAHPKVAEAAVIGVPDPIYEERVCAVIVLYEATADEDALRAELSAFVRERIAGYNVPRDWAFVESLPKTPVGKTMKHVLREQFGSMFHTGAHGGTSSGANTV
jgi:acyl-CoA synthetase (AMP-forming)/AMP-acid ligase II